jgi:hypothetical protein
VEKGGGFPKGKAKVWARPAGWPGEASGRQKIRKKKWRQEKNPGASGQRHSRITKKNGRIPSGVRPIFWETVIKKMGKEKI